MLYIVSTPIGNLKDITLRALETLKKVDYIAAEDTRHVQKLLKAYEIKTPTISYHSYSGRSKLDKLAEILQEGKTVALVSDAGTPGISDPAYALIQKAIELEVKVVPIPGASALLAGLVASGLPMDKFLYLGFLPLKKGRQTLLKNLQSEKRTMVIFESPHRLLKTLNDLKENFKESTKIAICREVTKMYEEIFRGSLTQAIEHFTNKKPKGEFTLVVKN
jgi:16S rRNA (cytidine1402-2'-O)-methyltransferase